MWSAAVVFVVPDQARALASVAAVSEATALEATGRAAEAAKAIAAWVGAVAREGAVRVAATPLESARKAVAAAWG